jgi:hypothetical protein
VVDLDGSAGGGGFEELMLLEATTTSGAKEGLGGAAAGKTKGCPEALGSQQDLAFFVSRSVSQGAGRKQVTHVRRVLLGSAMSNQELLLVSHELIKDVNIKKRLCCNQYLKVTLSVPCQWPAGFRRHVSRQRICWARCPSCKRLRQHSPLLREPQML